MDLGTFCTANNDLPNVNVNDNILIVARAFGPCLRKFAGQIHDASPRKHRPFACLSCESWPFSLIESELFGHVRGAFFGAFRDYDGVLARAHGGTLCVERIDRMPPSLLNRLVHASETGRATRVGDPATERTVDIRIIATAASTNARHLSDRFQLVRLS